MGSDHNIEGVLAGSGIWDVGVNNRGGGGRWEVGGGRWKRYSQNGGMWEIGP